ncbi:MAG: DUF1841 family protein [Steroidobacteraceae bacterium]|nr:DUF1841 family protein [Steroidobacteraceae bacterium]
MGDYSREQLRKAYAEAWSKARAAAPLTPLETMIVDVIAMHPEYHAILADLEATLAVDAGGDGGRENPFLHMGLHMAVREQLAIDRPPGVRAIHQRAVALQHDPHDAEHLLMEALGQTLWEAQRAGGAPDEQRYLAHARAALRR